jgi:hypothetical protein
MLIGKNDYEKAEADLKTLLNTGMSLGDALRIMHRERQVGLSFLWPAVASLQNVSKEEAMRIVVHETASRGEG